MRSFKSSAASLVLIGGIFLNALPSVHAQTAASPVGPVKGASIEGITEYRLANGLQVLLIPDTTTQNTTVNIVYRVGSRHEGYGETGMAHLLEHLVFKGTPKYGNIPNEMSKRGMAPNGTTSFDRTNYFATFPNTGDNLEFYLDMEADRMINSFIARKDLDSEFSVVRNEMESGENNPIRIMVQKVMATAYQWHNYGKSTIGARSDIENVKIENLQAFYRKFYQPDNATLVVGGNFDPAKTLELIVKKFGFIPKPTRVLEPTWTVDQPQDGERQIVVRRVGDEQYVLVGYHMPSGIDPNFPAVTLLDRIMNDSTSGRLYKALVETKKAASLVSGNFQQKEPGYLMFGARLTKEQSIEEVQDVIIKTVEEFAAAPPTQEEIDRQKRLWSSTFERIFRDANTTAQLMTDWVARGDWRMYFLYRDGLKDVKAEGIQRIAKTYLIQANRTVGKYIPTASPVRAPVKRFTDAEIVAMADKVKGGEVVAAGEAFDPTPANIEARVKRSTIGTIKTAFLSKENRGDSVTARLAINFGDAKSLHGLTAVGEMTARLLMTGTAKRTRQQLRDDLDKIKTQLSVQGNSMSVGANITTTRPHLAEALRIAAEVLREPSFPQDQFELAKAATLAGLESERSDPQQIVARASLRTFSAAKKGEPRYIPTLDEEIAEVKAVTLDSVKKFYKDFYGASNAQMSIVGDFDENEITPLATQLFADWKSPKKFTRVPQAFADIERSDFVFETPDKANAVYMARHMFKMRDDHADYPAMLLGNYMLGGGFLNSRLATRLRQREGISYGSGSSFSAHSLDEYGSFAVQAILAPENRQRLEAAVREELEKVIKDGFTDAEVAEAKQGWLLSRRRNRGSDDNLRGTFTTYLVLERTFAWDAELERKINALTTAEINAAVKKYIAPDSLSTFKAGDFAKSKQ